MEFYSALPVLKDFSRIFEKDHYRQVPQDWFLVLTDVVDSTGAIERGHYKEVNIAGALPAIAIANHFGSLDYPFVFGGDGMAMLIPEYSDELKGKLADTAAQIEDLYGLALRVAVFPVKDLPPIEVARLEVSEFYNQAVISGGLQYAESILKSAEGEPYRIEKSKRIPADFSGFTCRWKDIPGKQGVTFSLIVEFTDNGFPESSLQEVQRHIDRLGESHPLHLDGIELADDDYLENEARATSGQKSGLKHWLAMRKIKFERKICDWAMRYGIPLRSGWYDLSKLDGYQILSSDYRKFDGTLKMTLNTDAAKLGELLLFLEKMEATGRILYGLHRSDRAILTCMLHSKSRREVHFVDAADGGYALAGKMLKRKKQNLESPFPAT